MDIARIEIDEGSGAVGEALKGDGLVVRNAEECM
jgi:hypothetical protein